MVSATRRASSKRARSLLRTARPAAGRSGPSAAPPAASPLRAARGRPRPARTRPSTRPPPPAVRSRRRHRAGSTSWATSRGPTRPRSWCSWAMPNRSALSTTMTVASGTSTPTSITVVATSTSSPPAGTAPWPPPGSPTASARAAARPASCQLAGGQALELLGGRLRLHPRRVAHQRAHHEGAVAHGHLGPHPVPGRPGTFVAVTGDPLGRHGTRPGGISSSVVRSRSPKITMAAVAESAWPS